MLLANAFIGCLVAQTPSATPDDLFKRGAPTYIVGTAGDDRAACKEAGTTPHELEAAFRTMIVRP